MTLLPAILVLAAVSLAAYLFVAARRAPGDANPDWWLDAIEGARNPPNRPV